VIVWAFQVKPGSEAAFERMYGPDGDWAKFFRGDPKFRGTVLLRDAGRPGWYVTIDTWASREAYDTFRAWNRAEYAALDGRGKGLTLEETAISAGESVAGGA
jgi:heme-degrading monooxygenase HmoA